MMLELLSLSKLQDFVLFLLFKIPVVLVEVIEVSVNFSIDFEEFVLVQVNVIWVVFISWIEESEVSGVENLIIVETDDALLVCDLFRSQDVKKLVDTLKEEDRYEYKFHTTILRSWGRSTVLYETPGYQIKSVEILPGKYLSRQRHQHRSEYWIVVKGTAEVFHDEEHYFLKENESTHIPKTTIHRLGNPGQTPLEIIEIQLGEYLSNDDIERFDE